MTSQLKHLCRGTRLTRIRFGLKQLQPYAVVGGPSDAEPFMHSFFPASEMSGMIADAILPDGTAIVGCKDGERFLVLSHWRGDAWSQAVPVGQFENTRIEARARRLVEVDYPRHMELRRLRGQGRDPEDALDGSEWYKQGRMIKPWKELPSSQSL